MGKRRTPRALPSRAPWLDKEDVRRIAAWTEQFFTMCGFNQAPPQDMTHFTFSPYILKGHDGDMYKQMTKLSVRRGKEFDPARGKRYLEYLCFDDRFIEAYLDAQRKRWNPAYKLLYTDDTAPDALLMPEKSGGPEYQVSRAAALVLLLDDPERREQI